MKILLVNPPSQHMISSEIADVVREGGKLPPLGLLYLHTALRAAGHEAHFLDAGNANLSADHVAQKAVELSIDAVGVTATTHQMVDAVDVLRLIGERLPKVLRLLGGPHAAVFPEATARLPEVDALLVGEADTTLVELADSYAGTLSDPPPAGLLYEKDGTLVGRGECPKPKDLDSLPVPDRSVLDRSLYGDVAVGPGPLATVATSRGCPYACTFCSTPGLPVRLRDPNRVADELAELAAQGFREVYFVDDTFNVDPKRVTALCEELIRRKLDLQWTCRARVDQLTPELVAALKPAGCVRVQLGVEASTDEGMKVLGKNITTAQADQAVVALRTADVPVAAYFMLGTPDQRSIADLRHTVEFAIRLDPDYAVFNVLVPYPKTRLYDDGVAAGVIDPSGWQRFAERPFAGFRPPVWTEHLSADLLYRELKRAYRRFYLRPRVVGRQLRRINAGNVGTLFKRAWQVAFK